MSEQKTINIRQELINEIEKVIKTGRYPSTSEFVSEAVRLRLEELMHSEGFGISYFCVKSGLGVLMSSRQIQYLTEISGFENDD